MAAILLCETTAALGWFLEHSRLSVVCPGTAASAFPKDLSSRIRHLGENIGMAVAAPWVLNTHLEMLDGPDRPPLGADEAVLFFGGRFISRESQRAQGLDRPLSDVLSQLMVRGYADEQKMQRRQEFVKRLRALAEDARNGRAPTSTGGPAPSFARPSPHEVLGVPPDASRQEVRRAWKARALEYHPDRVANLGKKLQQLAEEETRSINAAYDLMMTQGT
jgi:DnaJ-domain-containing protein 1